MTVTEDPELAKRRAEVAEKDRLRQQKKLQLNMMREMERANRSLARSGLTKGATGLSVGALEDDDPLTPDRSSKPKTGARKRTGRGKYLDDDEDDDMPRGRTREDEYDKTDDFLVDSDEEDEEFDEGNDDDEDEAIDEGSEGDQVEEDGEGSKKASPKRGRPQEDQADRGDSGTQGPRGNEDESLKRMRMRDRASIHSLFLHESKMYQAIDTTAQFERH